MSGSAYIIVQKFGICDNLVYSILMFFYAHQEGFKIHLTILISNVFED